MGKFWANLLDNMGINDSEFDDDYDIEEEEFDEAPKLSNGLFGKKKKDDYEEEEEVFNKTYSSKPQAREAAPQAKTTTFRPRSTSTPSYQSSSSNSRVKVVPLSNAPINYIYIIKTCDLIERKAIMNLLIEGKTVILNLNGNNIPNAQRIIDSIGACCYTLDGSLRQISSYVFIAAPSNVDISGDFYQQIIDGAGGVGAVDDLFIDLANQS
ncbi:MAG: cell division protein SepF [Lachnospiraceae bacterium]|nr:cell division protein SepF [Lachnospiraceae bacterium]